jgi:hypothetical protein
VKRARLAAAGAGFRMAPLPLAAFAASLTIVF